MYNFFAYLSRMRNIDRWSLMRNTQKENIKEHSFDVVVVAHALAMIKNTYYGGNVDTGRVVELAAFHEAAEVITGDIATPIKYYNPKIAHAHKELEDIATQKLLDMLPAELRDSYSEILCHEGNELYEIVKCADKLCAYMKCIEELKSGNSEFERAAGNILGKLESIELPEVRYFMENFLPGYSLTLDELN